jgi:hypothetical protein
VSSTGRAGESGLEKVAADVDFDTGIHAPFGVLIAGRRLESGGQVVSEGAVSETFVNLRGTLRVVHQVYASHQENEFAAE